MNPYMFDNLVNSVKKHNSSYEQMYLMKVTIGAAGIVSASQVAHLMNYFSSDNDKLELAKMAYGYVFDTESYADIVGETFSSDEADAYLNEYINRYRYR